VSCQYAPAIRVNLAKEAVDKTGAVKAKITQARAAE
jgi:hypothetical protein